MRDFFKPWRRKAGCVTLVMACLFAAGWVRSRSFHDTFTHGVVAQKMTYGLTSCPLGISLVKSEWGEREKNDHGVADLTYPDFTDVDTIIIPSWWNCNRIGPNDDFHQGFFLFQSIDWRWKFCGIDFGQTHNHHDPIFRRKYWLFPYWSIVLPLTLLSAYLLLSKPRPPKPPESP
jgi:hypothetical protein